MQESSPLSLDARPAPDNKPASARVVAHEYRPLSYAVPLGSAFSAGFGLAVNLWPNAVACGGRAIAIPFIRNCVKREHHRNPANKIRFSPPAYRQNARRYRGVTFPYGNNACGQERMLP